ncbi:MAG: hypothetical protein BRC25_03320 [Parcubacteria group bacterium SW_6_46_9]|nr:MAG: hypothetical protein BRC25_03320 [Parcubacteria group bacterium SW_6_46_9]
MLYEDCGQTVTECIKYLKDDIQSTYEERDYRNVVKFLDTVSGLLDGEMLLTEKGKQYLRDEAHRIGKYEGWTGFCDPISEEELLIAARQTAILLRQEMIVRSLQEQQNHIRKLASASDNETLFDHQSGITG